MRLRGLETKAAAKHPKEGKSTKAAKRTARGERNRLEGNAEDPSLGLDIRRT